MYLLPKEIIPSIFFVLLDENVVCFPFANYLSLTLLDGCWKTQLLSIVLSLSLSGPPVSMNAANFSTHDCPAKVK